MLLKRLIAGLALPLALSQLSFAQDLKRQVTFTSNVAPLERVLAELSKASGIQLVPGAGIKDELLLVSVQDVPLDLLMNRVAETISCQWTRDGAIFRLSRTAAAEKALKAEERASRLAEIEKELEGVKAAAGSLGAFDKIEAQALATRAGNLLKRAGGADPDWYTEASKAAEKGPMGRLYARVMASFPSEELLHVTPGSRVVFSTAPNKLQRLLAGSHAKAMDQFIQEQEVYVSAARPIFKSDVDETLRPNYNLSIIDPRSATKLPLKLLLVCKSEATGAGAVSMELLVADAEGKVVGRHQGRIRSTFGVMSGPALKDPVTVGTAKLQLPPRTSELLDHIRPVSGRNNPPSALEEARQAFLNPTRIDPLELVVGDGVLAAAKALHLNVVLQPHDALFMATLSQLATGELTAEAFFPRMEVLGQMKMERKDNWLLALPKRPVTAKALQLNRRIFGVLMERYKKEGRLSLDNMARFAFEHGHEPMLFSFISMFMFPDQHESVLESWHLHRFYASLTPEQRAAVAQGNDSRPEPFGDGSKGKRLKLGQLGQRQVELLADLIYSVRLSMTYKHDYKAGVNSAETLASDVTEAFPQGLPPDGELSIALVTEPAFFASVSKPGPGAGQPRPMSVHELAWLTFTPERPDLFPWAAQMPVYDQFQPGKSLLWHFDFVLSEWVSTSKSLRDNELDASVPKAKLSELPEPFRSDLTNRIEALRKAHAKSKPGGTIGGKPPLHDNLGP
jgi:hypothetical protein